MDLKERLLQNEIQNLGQIIQTLSYELILLQDFMKEEYGKKFEAFRNKYSSETETNSDAFASSSTLGGPSSKESKSKSLEVSCSRIADDEYKQENNNEPVFNTGITEAIAKQENKIHSDSDNQSDNDMDFDEVEVKCDGEPSDSDAPCGDKDEDGYSDDSFKGNSCWSKFLVGTDLHGKRTATCNVCHTVHSSPRVHRLVGHLKKCRRDQTQNKSGSLGRPKLEVPCNEDNPIDGLNDLDRSGNDPEDDGSCFSSDGVYSDDEIANEAKALKDPLETESEKKGGRKKMKIWKYFETVKLRNGKFSAKCHLCSNLISARAPRMVEHRIKCSRMSAAQRAAVKKGRPRKKGIDSALQRLKQEDSDNDNSSTNINNTEDTIEKESLAIETSGEHSSSQKTATTIGRHPDLIWAYFTIIQKDNLKKAKCIACGQIVSPKAGRMRIHKSVCQEVSTAETHSSPSLLASGDDSNNNT